MIDGILGPSPRPALPRRAAGASGSGAAMFRIGMNAETGSTQETGAEAPGEVASAVLCGLLAVQEAVVSGDAEPRARDRRARGRGQELLAELGALQRDLLRAGPDAARLGRLATLLDDVPLAVDPGLRAVIAAIATRARIELARRGSAPPLNTSATR